MYCIFDAFSYQCSRTSTMLWFFVLLGIDLCYGIVIRINPAMIISYKRNNSVAETKDVIEHRINFLDVNSTAGEFLVDKRYGSRLFWWFFRSENRSETDPVIIWFQGQPNASVLYGLFDEHGPYAIDPTTRALVKREHRWTKSFNVLYMDLFTSSGYSYAKHPKGYSLQLKDVSRNVISALHLFYQRYPALMNNSLYLAGESMSAKYLFVIAHGIYQLSRYESLAINLTGLIIGNGFMQSMEVARYCKTLLQFGLLKLKTYDMMNPYLPSIQGDILAGNYQSAIERWTKYYYSAVLEAGYNSMYDVRNVNAFWDSLVPEVATSEQIRQLLGVANRTFSKAQRGTYFIGEVFKSITPIVSEILNRYQVLFYTGQFDMMVPYIHTATFLDEVQWEGSPTFATAEHSSWGLKNETLFGYWKRSCNVHHVVIRNAGHFVGVTHPEVLLRMVRRFVFGKGSPST